MFKNLFQKIIMLSVCILLISFVFPVPTGAKAATKYAKVTFNSQGGSSVTSKKVAYNKLVSAPSAPKKKGYTFGGWYKDTKFKSTWNFKTEKVKKNTTLYAKWKINTYQVTFNSKGGTSIISQKIQYNKLATTPKQPIRIGYSFAGWYKDTKYKTVWKFGSNKVSGNITLYAKWSGQKAKKVTYLSNGGSTVSPKSVPYNSLLSLPTPTKTGYTLSGWYKESSLKTLWNQSTNRVTTNLTLYAKWTPKTYTVKFETQGGSGVSNKSVKYNSSFTAPPTPKKDGYLFEGWYTNPNLLSKWNFSKKITNSMTLYARWKITPTSSYMAIIPSNISALNIRKEPSTSSKILGTLTSNTIVYVNECSDFEWYQIQYEGQNAYIRKALDAENKKIAVQLTAYASIITASGSGNIYATPSFTSKVVATIKKGSYINVLPLPGNQDFVQVSYSGGKTGYLSVTSMQRLFYNTMNIHMPSSVTASQINTAIDNYVKKNKVSSALKGQEQSFIDVGKQSGINPLVLAAIAIHESGWGTNNLSQKKNNIYSVAAYDDAPYDAAYTFDNVKEAIQYQANFLNQNYLDTKFSSKLYSAGDFLGTGGLIGEKIGDRYKGTSGINYYYSTDVNWGASIAYICQLILPYNEKDYAKAKPMSVESLNNITLLKVEHNFTDPKLFKTGITGKNKGNALTLYTDLGGSTAVTDGGNIIKLANVNTPSATNNGTFRVLSLCGNLRNGWMKISINNPTNEKIPYIGYVNFGGLSGYSKRFTLDNLMRNISSGNYEQQINSTLPSGYIACFR